MIRSILGMSLNLPSEIIQIYVIQLFVRCAMWASYRKLACFKKHQDNTSRPSSKSVTTLKLHMIDVGRPFWVIKEKIQRLYMTQYFSKLIWELAQL
jgi:hypothetical protein